MEFGFAHNQLPGSLELAYLGDAIYELYVREMLVRKGGHVKALHKGAISYVNAHAQALALEKVEPELNEDELTVVRRARNAKQSPTKNADLAEYHRATAFEALIGYLYLTEKRERMERFIREIIEAEP